MKHDNYVEITARSNRELGRALGELFSRQCRLAVEEAKSGPAWKIALTRAPMTMEIVDRFFPRFREELDGYAEAAGVRPLDLWALNEPPPATVEKCTTMVTNAGTLIGHNEDWGPEARHSVCVLKKTVSGLTILELYYYHGLGGNAFSVNSNGHVQAINSLFHADARPGIPASVVGRWLSQTTSAPEDVRRLSGVPRATGYSHTIIDKLGNVFNVEFSARKHVVTRPDLPFVHSNHYLTRLRAVENGADLSGSRSRLKQAQSAMLPSMSVDRLQTLMGDGSRGKYASIFNANTIARAVIDLRDMALHIWLHRERNRGWRAYPLDFIHE